MVTIPSISQRPIKASTRFGGVLGRGIAHSLSPFLHNTAAALLGIDAVYHAFDLAHPPSEGFFDSLLHSNCYGFNVTVPYKETIARLFPSAQLTSANTLVNKGDRWEAASTDGEGFLLGLEDIECSLDDFESVICLGYGGAAKALFATISAQKPALPLFALKRGEPVDAGIVTLQTFEPESLKRLLTVQPKSLVIQCTNAPLHGDDLGRFSESIKGLKGAFVDLVYGHPSALLQSAKQRGIKAQDGLPMLLSQALLSQKLWWGQSADFSAMKAALKSHLT